MSSLADISRSSCGDYASGTNHTLPTYGYAKQYSGVSTLSFLKHITAQVSLKGADCIALIHSNTELFKQELTKDGLRALGPVVEILANAEGLDAHKNAVTIRLKALAEEV